LYPDTKIKHLEAASLLELADRCARSDRSAQAALFHHFQSDFLKVCLRYASDEQDANSMLSDAFFKIFTRIDTYKREGSFEGWMRRIVVNTCLSHVRSAASRRSDSVDDFGNIGSHLATSNEAMSSLGIREIAGFIRQLPPMSRAVFNLYVFEGYSHKEISAELKMSEGTSHWHLSKARQWLQQKIKTAQ
jgi:RNA polymerase sigma factor (sigma-70 family)